MSEYDKYKESVFTHEEMQPMIIETDEVELMRHALECVVLYWDEWKDAPEDHPTALSLEEVVDMCRAHLGEKK